ncbi:MAG: hypothetical protein HY042_11115, partial [Spirochaetia bacterium]|nr:hypothetical protein [Spirochaetia bacterium]
MAAETKTQFTDEEVGQIQTLLGSLKGDPDGVDFSPMADQFKADLDAVKSILQPEEEAPLDTSLPLADQDAGFMADEIPTVDAAETSGDAADFPSDFGASLDAEAPVATDNAGETLPDFDFGSMSLDAGGTAEPPADTTLAGGETTEDSGADFGADLGTDFGADFNAEPSGLGDAGADLGADFGTGDLDTTSPGLGADDLGAATDLGTSDFDTGDLGTGATSDLGDLAGDAGADFGASSDLGGADLGGDFGGADLGASPDLGGDDLGADAGADFGASSDLGADLGGDSLADLGTGSSSDLGGLGDDDLGLPADTSAGADLGGADFGSSLTESPTSQAAAPEDELGLDFAGLGDFTTDLSSGTPETTAQPSAGGMDDLTADLGSITDSGELAAMTEQAQMDQGIGDEFTDEELARIRTNLNDYPPGIRKSAIDSIVSEKISRADQRLLVNMIADQAQPESVADFLESRLGYRPDIAPSNVRKDGIQIIYTDQVSPEDMASRRQRAKMILIAAGAGVLAIALAFSGYYFYRTFFVRGMYERGLEELTKAREAPGDEREERRKRAEELFQKAKDADGGVYNVDYLNRYGIAYMKAGFYEDAFVKLYGRVKPDYGTESPDSAWSKEGQRAPLIRVADGSSFPSPSDEAGGRRVVLTARDNVMRTVEIPGAYIVSRLRDGHLDRQNVLALARFHSNRAGSFLRNEEGRKYKNDDLGIDYYRLILTLLNKPDDAEAMAGIGDVYYNRKEFGSAAREYTRILDRH